jgi:hypothetical protein
VTGVGKPVPARTFFSSPRVLPIVDHDGTPPGSAVLTDIEPPAKRLYDLFGLGIG